MNRIIVWEPDEILNEENENEILETEDEIEEIKELDDNEAQITNEDGRTIRVKMPKSQQVVHTNFGSFLQHHPDNPYNSREVWIAYTNFDITNEDGMLISRVPGVEALRLLTRYSFTIIVGLVFYPNDVIKEIENVLGVENKVNEISQKRADDNQELIDSTIKNIKSEFWHCYIMPNGETIIETYKSNTDMLERKEFFEQLRSMSAGLMLSSDDK